LAFPVAGAFVVALSSESRRFENLAREPERLRSEHLKPGLVSLARNLAQ
jgi:hypothetical protein